MVCSGGIWSCCIGFWLLLDSIITIQPRAVAQAIRNNILFWTVTTILGILFIIIFIEFRDHDFKHVVWVCRVHVNDGQRLKCKTVRNFFKKSFERRIWNRPNPHKTTDTQNVGVMLATGVILQVPKKTSLNVVGSESFYPSAVRTLGMFDWSTI